MSTSRKRSRTVFCGETAIILEYALVKCPLSGRDAAFLLQVHEETVYEWAKRCGISLAYKNRAKPKTPSEHRVRVDESLSRIPVAIELAKSGAPDGEIARAISRSQNWVRICLSRARKSGERVPYQVVRRSASAAAQVSA